MSRASAARNQRRSQKSPTDGRPNVKVVPAQVMGQEPQAQRASQLRNPQFLTRLRRLVSGEDPSPNRMVTYLLGQLRDAETELNAIDRNLKQGEAQIAQMREELNRVDGRVQARVDDLANWIDEAADAPQAEPEPEAEPAPAAAAAP